MPSVRKVLGQVAPAAATNTDLYTVPASTQTVVSTLTVANRGPSAGCFASPSAPMVRPRQPALRLLGHRVPAQDAFAATLGLTLDAGDVVTVWAANDQLSFSLFGEEAS